MRRTHLLTPPQSLSTTNNSPALLNNPIVFYQQERYWTHHTRATLDRLLPLPLRGQSPSTDVDFGVGLNSLSESGPTLLFMVARFYM